MANKKITRTTPAMMRFVPWTGDEDIRLDKALFSITEIRENVSL
jgi:hypothetical protein